jgi:hypothetical protein
MPEPAHSGDKPLLFVDIDGVISLFGFEPTAPPPGTWIGVDGVLHLISATASGHLLELTRIFDLVWCSGWEEKANDSLLADLGLPDPLPFLTFSVNERAPHWKLPAIVDYAGGRPLAWVDDAHDDASRAWASAREAPTLLVETNPATGLTAAHVVTLEGWADAL